VVHEEDGTHHGHVVDSEDDRVDLEHPTEATEHGGNPDRVDMFGLEASGRGQSADTGTVGDAAVGLLTLKVDAGVLVEEGLHVDGRVALRAGGEAQVHGADRGADDLERHLGGDAFQSLADSNGVVEEGVRGLDEDDGEATRSLDVPARHEDLEVVWALGLPGDGRGAPVRGDRAEGGLVRGLGRGEARSGLGGGISHSGGGEDSHRHRVGVATGGS
jgi:hypothetical protein